MPIRAAVIQQRGWPDKQQSLAESERLLAEVAAKQKPDLVLLQELHTTHYFCQVEDPALFDLAEPLDGPSAQRLSALARKYDCVLVGGIFERRAAGVFHNTALVFERDGSLAGYFRKMHIPDDPAFYEKFYFTPGDARRNDGTSGFSPIATSVGKLGVLICWDQWYPEGARLMALAGADVLLYPTAIGWDPDDAQDEKDRQRNAWLLSHRGHAVANGLPVLSCNRVGHEPSPLGASGIRFWGSSHVLGPQGEVLAEAGSDDPQVLMAEVDLGRSEHVRRIWPFLRDRRIDAYQDLLKRYRD
jgi:N-carbamoylputrescine amidase